VTQPSSFQRARIGERAEITRIKKAVATVYGVPVAQMEGAPRGNEAVVHARHVAMWCARRLTPATWAEIGRRFGRSPSSAAAAVKHLVYLDRDHIMIARIMKMLDIPTDE
jgi:chromosomal replication initiation ATPase DnaA